MKIKNLFLFLWVMVMTVTLYATDKSQTDAVTLVSYEQSWIDHEGTLSLKNHTNKDIRNIKFRIIYLDMSGEQLDYKDFYKKIEIAPGMTRKMNIPAYENERFYSYYQSEASPLHPKKFKIKFELLNYNLTKKKTTTSKETSEVKTNENEYVPKEEDSYMDYFSESTNEKTDLEPEDNINKLFYSLFSISSFSFILAIIASIVILCISVGLYVVVALMAKKRNRNVIFWVLISFFVSPILPIIILLVIGKDEKSDKSDLFNKW